MDQREPIMKQTNFALLLANCNGEMWRPPLARARHGRMAGNVGAFPCLANFFISQHATCTVGQGPRQQA
ncbi:hypothetical protein DsansV1_C25g0188161 [Dioscorea sansibarensis]